MYKQDTKSNPNPNPNPNTTTTSPEAGATYPGSSGHRQSCLFVRDQSARLL